MRKLILILSALGLSARAQASPGPHVDEQAVFGGGYFGDRFEVSSPLFKPYYILEASAHGFRYPSAFSGTAVEYSAALRRELYHVSIAGRLGTRPPGAEGESYHLAAGEGIMTFYGLALGPEHPDLSGQVWESSGPAPAPKSLDRTWVTRLRGRFTTTNHHFANPPGFVLIQNSIQFDVTETWRERSTLTLHAGAHVYNEPVTRRPRLCISTTSTIQATSWRCAAGPTTPWDCGFRKKSAAPGRRKRLLQGSTYWAIK